MKLGKDSDNCSLGVGVVMFSCYWTALHA